MSGPEAEIRVGNALPIANIPVGTTIHNIELHIGKGGQMVRAAGTSAQLLAKEGRYAHVRLPSGEVRLVNRAVHGHYRPGGQHRPRQYQAGQGRPQALVGLPPVGSWFGHGPGFAPAWWWRGPVAHRYAGPKSPWGKPTLGYKTRRNKSTDKWIVRRRGKKRG